MKNFKKVMAALLVAVMTCALLAGCGKKEETTGTTKATTKATTAATTAGTTAGTTAASKEDIGQITAMGVDWGYGPDSESSMLQWWEEYFDVDMAVEWVSYKDYQQKMNTLLASGNKDNLPDVVQVYKTNGSFYYPAFAAAVDAGWFVDLTDELKGENGIIANSETMSAWNEDIWAGATYKDSIYVIPRAVNAPAVNSGITVRLDLMEQYNMMEEPTTMADLQTWLLDLADKSGLYAMEYSTDDPTQYTLAYATAFTGQGLWGVDANGKYCYLPFADGYIDFLDWMKKFYEAGAIDPEFILKQQDVSKWKGGKSVSCLVSYLNWNQSADLTTDKIFDKGTPDTYKAWCLQPVKGPKGYSIANDAYGFGECIAVNSKVSDAKLAKILEVFNTEGEEYLDVLLYGVEGLHYDWVDGSRVKSEEQKVANTAGYVGAWNQIFLKPNMDLVAQKFCREGARAASATNQKRAYEIYDNVGKLLAEMGGLVDPTRNKISETYNASWNVIIADAKDMASNYIMGNIGASEWNAYVKSVVEGADYQKVVSEFMNY